MNGWANVSILGILGGDAEVRVTGSGKKKTELNVAVTRTWKDNSGQKREETTWIRCTDWADRPDWLIQKLTKGSPVAITGRLHQSTWEKDGVKQSRLEVNVEQIEPLTKPQFNGERRFNDGSGTIQQGPQDEDRIPF